MASGRAKSRIRPGDRPLHSVLVWGGVALAMAIPIVLAATSPLLAWRQPIYIAAGFAGIVGLALMLLQPMLVAGYLPGLRGLKGRKGHRWTGGLLILSVVLHVLGLWITSPPDVIDVLLFRSPAAFSYFGVIAMWAIFAAGLMAVFRDRLRWSVKTWRRSHAALATLTVVCTGLHAVLIEGAMETVSKSLICALVLFVTARALVDLRILPKR